AGLVECDATRTRRRVCRRRNARRRLDEHGDREGEIGWTDLDMHLSSSCRFWFVSGPRSWLWLAGHLLLGRSDPRRAPSAGVVSYGASAPPGYVEHQARSLGLLLPRRGGALEVCGRAHSQDASRAWQQ